MIRTDLLSEGNLPDREERRHALPSIPYSVRNATIGLTRVARRAGTKHDSAAKNFLVEPSRCPREISRQVGIELSNRVLQRRTEGISTLSGTRTHKDGAKLRGGIGAEQRQEKSRAIGLLIERTLHQRVWDDTDDGSPRLWVARIEDSNPMTDRAFTAIMFSRKTGVYHRDWLL